MRCSQHPDRIASKECAVCGTFCCSECLTLVAGESVCPACEPAAQRQRSTPPTGQPRTARGYSRAIGVTSAIVLAAGLSTLALWPRDDPSPTIPPATDPRERDALGRQCFNALELAAVAVETHRAERGTYAESWDELIPDLMDAAPIDPWDPSGGGLRLQKPDWDSEGIVLYSVGPDRRDDGGRLYSVETGRGDWVYRVR